MKERPLIVHFCHHKTGTAWFMSILRKISEEFDMKFQQCKQSHLDEHTNIWLEWSSIVDFTKLRNYVGSHMIRDPRDLIISGYFYHLWTDEEWCKRPNEIFNHTSYQEVLNSLTKEEGIIFEMRNASYTITKSMLDWNYQNPNILEIKYEDYILNVERFGELFQKYGFNDKQIKIALKIADERSLQNLRKRKLGMEQTKNHLRKGVPGDWKNHFTEKHKKEFKKLYGDALISLNYEKNNEW